MRPVPNVAHPVDGRPEVAAPAGHRPGPFARWLARREHRYYDHILPPDVLIVLRVPPDVAAARRADQDTTVVRRRVAEVFAADWADTCAVVIDATQPIEDVRAQIMTAVWAAL